MANMDLPFSGQAFTTEDQTQVRLLATDIDGTLTDGGMYYSSTGETFKRFYVRDGLGVQLLQAVGIEVAFISSDSSPMLEKRAQRLGVKYCFSGVRDKVSVMQSLCIQANVDPGQVAFLGDDLQDLYVMKFVGLPVAVGDAHPLIKQISAHICAKPGGFGAFRELAEALIVGCGISVQDAYARIFANE
jgi:3-deoxy-D-manno-octulosonate 8-phosphate phosphatase (KDO 8-P phosphatase)